MYRGDPAPSPITEEFYLNTIQAIEGGITADIIQSTRDHFGNLIQTLISENARDRVETLLTQLEQKNSRIHRRIMVILRDLYTDAAPSDLSRIAKTRWQEKIRTAIEASKIKKILKTASLSEPQIDKILDNWVGQGSSFDTSTQNLLNQTDRLLSKRHSRSRTH